MSGKSRPVELAQYPLTLQQSVIWGDMDAFGHVNNTVYFRYFEDARMAYFDHVGVSAYKLEHQKGPILANTHCDFRLPLEYPDQIQIGARCTLEGSKKIDMHYLVYSERYGAIAAQGRGLIVFYDYSEGRSCEIPDAIRVSIEAFERSGRV